MDRDKFKLFKSGLTEEEKEKIRKHEAVQAKFENESGKVHSTMRSQGFSIILDKILDDMEVAKHKLQTCKEKDLARLQLEIEIRKEFLAKWTPYAG